MGLEVSQNVMFALVSCYVLRQLGRWVVVEGAKIWGVVSEPRVVLNGQSATTGVGSCKRGMVLLG